MNKGILHSATSSSVWRSSIAASFLHHVTLGGSPLKNVEPIYKVHHKIARERIGGGIPYIIGCHTSVDVAPLLQNIVYFKTDGAIFLFE